MLGSSRGTHYRGTFNDGTQFHFLMRVGEPLEFTCGVGQMIKGFDEQWQILGSGSDCGRSLMPGRGDEGRI